MTSSSITPKAEKLFLLKKFSSDLITVCGLRIFVQVFLLRYSLNKASIGYLTLGCSFFASLQGGCLAVQPHGLFAVTPLL